VIVPVSNVERSLSFYTDSCGFGLDVDYHPIETFRVVQLTPQGSSCSIQFGLGLTNATPGSLKDIYLTVTDIEAVRNELLANSVQIDTIRRKTHIENWQGATEEGLDPQRRDYASFATFADPDGNTWTLQEIGFTARTSRAQ
jgi:catechol 2,3-dioxygenase-like lactoylglutathione lyase family enzyme